MHYKTWSKLVALSGFFIIFSLAMINYVIDPFNIFHTQFFPKQFQMNERFIKVEFLQEHHADYNGYIFGSSRIGTTSPRTIEKYHQNTHFYNMSLSAANMEDYLSHLKYFIDNNYPIDTLYLQIDLVDTLIGYGHPKDRYLTKKHPYIVGDSLLSYYISYLTIYSSSDLKGKLQKNLASDKQEKDLEKVIYDLEDTGTWGRPNKELALKDDAEQYIKNVKSFHIPDPENTYRKDIKSYPKIITAFKEINQICLENNIEFIVFTTPHNHNMLHGVNSEDAMMFMRDLVSIHDLWYFSGYNSITTNDENYYESSHYRPYIGDLIAAKIFHDTTIDIPKNFGILLTTQNINTFVPNELKRLKDSY